jgi:hypothetical protein
MPDKVHCCHILVKTETEAKNAKARLDKGEKFGAVAQQVSLCLQERKAEISALLQEVKWLKNLRKLLSNLRKDKLLFQLKPSLGTT